MAAPDVVMLLSSTVTNRIMRYESCRLMRSKKLPELSISEVCNLDLKILVRHLLLQEILGDQNLWQHLAIRFASYVIYGSCVYLSPYMGFTFPFNVRNAVSYFSEMFRNIFMTSSRQLYDLWSSRILTAPLVNIGWHICNSLSSFSFFLYC